MRWARFKKRNMENGKWVSKGATNGGGAVTEDGGEELDVNEGTPSKKRKKSQVVKETKKVAKKDVKDGVDDDAEEDDEQEGDAQVNGMTDRGRRSHSTPTYDFSTETGALSDLVLSLYGFSFNKTYLNL